MNGLGENGQCKFWWGKLGLQTPDAMLACPATEKCKDYRGRVGLSFYWNVFDIKGMVWEKMVNVNFGGIR
jgi:hypothetical protein